MSVAAKVDRILELMAVPGKPGVYVLGSFARYVTLYSQQVRALNLIYALNQTGKLGVDNTVAIVGGGAAGLTAAVAAARLGAKVTVLEKRAKPMGVQLKSLERWIHPHIYDWPLKPVSSNNAQLPIFSWNADYADPVARRFLIEWGKETARYRDAITTYCNVTKVAIPRQTPQHTRVTWNPGARGDEFDCVILAVGFGLEEIRWADDRRYWDNDQLDRDIGEKRKCLVSGYGDGGLTDVMRLCIKDFKHDQILKMFADHKRSKELGQNLIEREMNHLSAPDPRAISIFYQNLEATHVQEVLESEDMLRTDTEVYLTGPDFLDVYSSKSSILNRFVVSQLARMGRWQWLNGPIDVPPTRDLVSGQYRVRFTPSGDAPYEELFKVVVLRHGPKPALEHDFPAIWQACQKLAAEWREMPPHLDPTREPLKWQPLFDRPPRARFQPAPPPLPDEFKLVAFDIDGTLLRGKDFIWSWSLVWSFLGYEDEERRNLMRNYRGTLIEGREGWHEAYQSWCDEAADRFKEKGLKRSDFTEIAKAVAPVSGLGETIHALKAAGIHLAIISGGIDQLIEATLSKYLPDFHDIYVNKFLFDEQGLFTGVEATRYDFKGKVDAVLEICDKYDLSPDQAVFVGDGFNDVHLLDNVGRTICFIGTDEEMENESDVRLVFPNGDPDLRAILPHILPAGRAPRNG